MTRPSASPSLPLAHPDVQSAVRTVFSALVRESDRGAVLIAADVLDDRLADLFQAVAPAEAPQRLVKNLLSYPGALGSFAAKADVALALVERAREASEKASRTDPDARPLFETDEEIERFLRDSDGIMDGIRDRHSRVALAAGVTFISALIVHHGDQRTAPSAPTET